jgi:hypothetical protein
MRIPLKRPLLLHSRLCTLHIEVRRSCTDRRAGLESKVEQSNQMDHLLISFPCLVYRRRDIPEATLCV